MKFGNTNREVIYNLRHSIAELGTLSDESSFSNRELYFLLLRFRAYIIAEKIRDKRFQLSKHNYQTIGCIPVDEVDAVECPCAPDSGFTFLKTRWPIPVTIGPIRSVISPGNHITYDYVQWDAIQDLRKSRFKAERNKPFYTMKTSKDGTYLYLYNDKHGKFITVTGIFENPLEVQNFPDCNTGELDPCFAPLDQEFIIDADLLPKVFDLVLTNRFKYKNPVSDILNDDKDDSATEKQPRK